MSCTLLRTKLEIPIIRQNLIQRSRLLDRLNECFFYKLTTVCAPAGFGKTTCLSQWTLTGDHRIAWFSIDVTDNNQNRFWTYVITALNNLDSAIGETALSFLNSSPNPSIEMVLTALINDIISWEKPAVLILDDYHLIQNESIYLDMSFLLNRLSPQLHIIIVSRSNRHIPLSRLRIQGQLLELDVYELCFTQSETIAFFDESIGLKLKEDQIRKLIEKTEGWIAGLQLVALSMKGKNNANSTLEGFGGSQQHLADYLFEEVLGQQTEIVQTFLFQTSILERFCGPLCEFVTGINESSQILEMLESVNLFVFPLDKERKWFRYHSMFKEILVSKCYKTRPVLLAGLHRQAGIWFKNNGYRSDAIHHMLLSGDHSLAADLIDSFCLDLLFTGETATIIDWLAELPEGIIRLKPGICITQALICILNPSEGAHQMIENRLLDAEKAISDNLQYDNRLSYRNKITRYIEGLRAGLPRERGNSLQRVIEFAKNELKSSPKIDPFWRCSMAMNLAMAYRTAGDAHSAIDAISKNILVGENFSGFQFIRIYSTYLLAQTKFIQGHIREAAQTCHHAIDYKEIRIQNDQKKPLVLGALYVCLGTILLEQNKLPEAEQLLIKGIEQLKILKDLDSLLSGYAGLIKLKIAQQVNFSEINSLISEMEQLGVEAFKYGTVLRINQLWSQAETNPERMSATALLVQKHGFELEDRGHLPGIDHIGQRRYEQQLAMIRFLIAQHMIFFEKKGQTKLTNVITFLDRKYALASERGLTMRIIQILILKSLTWQACGKVEVALDELQQAFSLAAGSGFFRIFLDEGEPMTRLLRKAVSRGIHPEYSIRLLRAMGNNGGKPIRKTPMSIGFMSDRELQILRLVTAGLSNREISKELYIAVGTVKKHLDNIYNKLNVHKRTQAIARARELSIL